MKWLSIALLAVVVFAFSPAKPADAAVAFGFSAGFHDELSPYGAWVNYSNYGNCWRPYGTGYRPYVNGYWAYSNYGPTWYGNEAWAPYTYNYGQWIYTAQFGWIWVPGYDWHRNYVDWTYGDGYIGWRPAFPAGYYYPGGNDFNLWVVIDANHFGYHNYSPYVYRTDFVRNLWNRRVFRQRYDRLDRTQLERITRRPVQTVNLRERDVRIGNRTTRMFVTPDQETKIQRHVEQVRRTGNVRDERQFNDRRDERQFNDRRDERQFNDRKNERQFNDHKNDRNVMHQRFEDIRNRSERNNSSRDRQFERQMNDQRHENDRRNNVERRDSRSFESHRRNEEPKNYNRPQPDHSRERDMRNSHEQRFSTVQDRREVTRSEQHGRNDVRVEKNRSEKKHQDKKPPHSH